MQNKEDSLNSQKERCRVQLLYHMMKRPPAALKKEFPDTVIQETLDEIMQTQTN